jgi:hypothetical protein
MHNITSRIFSNLHFDCLNQNKLNRPPHGPDLDPGDRLWINKKLNGDEEHFERQIYEVCGEIFLKIFYHVN